MQRKLAVFFLIVTLLMSLLLTACGGGSAKNNEGSVAKPEGNEKREVKMVDSLTLTTVGGSAGGFWSLLGEGIGSIIRESVPNTQYSYETGNGVANTINVSSGEIPLGIAFSFEIKAGLGGEEPFPNKVPQVTALATLYDNSPAQFIITKEFAQRYGINSIEDIAAKKPPIRVSLGQRGNLTEVAHKTILEAYGITYDDIRAWGGQVFHEPVRPSADLMKNNRADLIAGTVFAPDANFQELSLSKELKLLSINEDARKLVNERMGMSPGVIAANTYQWQPEEITTANAGAMLIVDPNMSIDEAYTITKIIVENIDKYTALHKNLTSMTPEKMANVSPAILHPGAKKYFEEAGILK
jgi:TRAP transporter TAXI family solute receptor